MKCTIGIPDREILPMMLSSLEYILFFKMANGKAPGLTAWTYDLIKLVGEVEEGRKLMCAYAQEIVNNEVEEEIMRVYKTSRLIPLIKDEEMVDVRHIAVGECFRRWVAAAINLEVIGH
jgi:hypothetical protein